MDSGTLRGISPSTRRKVSILLETLRKDPNFELFIHPIDPVNDGCLDYFEVIKNPMDLLTVSNKLLNDQYKSVNEMYQDIILIFSNCREYNTSPLCSHIIDLCDKSESRFLLEWTKLGFSDKSAKKRLEELSKETNNNNKLVNSRPNSNTPDTNNSSKSNQKNVKLKPSNTNTRGNPNRVVLKIDKSPTTPTPPPCNTNNKRQKGESNKKTTNNSCNHTTPLKKRRESDRPEPITTKEDATSSISTQTNASGNQSSNQKQTNSDPDPTLCWKNECLRILNLLRKEHNSFLFENPVLESEDLTKETKNRYREVIPEACDYITIEKCLVTTENLKKHHSPSLHNSRRRSSSSQSSSKNDKTNPKIDNPHEFERLVKLIFSNCMTFNPNSGDCKWIYDSAKQSLNKFNNLWSKSNVFLLYSNAISSPSAAAANSAYADPATDIKDHQSETTSIGGFSITTTTQHKNNNSSSSQLPTSHNATNSSIYNNIKFNMNSRNTHSSFNKTITQWNNYSIVWKQFILNKHNNDHEENHSKPTPTTNINLKKNSRSNKNKNNSNANLTNKVYFKISPNDLTKTTHAKCNKNIKRFFDFNNDTNDHDSNKNMVIIVKDKDDDYLVLQSNDCLDLTRKSNNENEYIFPLQIYDLKVINSNKNILNMIHYHHNHQGRGACSSNYCHSMHVKVTKESIIFIYCFQSSSTKCKDSNNQNDYINSISNMHYFAYTSSHEFINKYIELKVKIPKSINDFIIPIVKQYHIDNILISNVNIVINNVVKDDLNSIINIQFGNIL